MPLIPHVISNDLEAHDITRGVWTGIRRRAQRAKMVLPGAVVLAAFQRSELALANPKHVAVHGVLANRRRSAKRRRFLGRMDRGGELAGKSSRTTCFTWSPFMPNRTCQNPRSRRRGGLFGRGIAATRV